MTGESERRRRSLEPDKDFIHRQFVLSGKSYPDFAEQCGCSERTLGNILAGKRVDRATLEQLATKLKISPWFNVLSDAEKTRLGLAPSDAIPQDPAADLLVRQEPSKPILTPSTRLFQLPAALADFIGRADQIEKLVGRLRDESGKVRLAALHGMGGIGKTSLAVRVAREVQDCYPDAQLFLELRGTADGVKNLALTSVEAMTRIIHAFHPAEVNLPDDEQQLAGRYRGVLAGKRALIVLDNAGSEAQVRSLLTAAPPVAFVVTSRHGLALDGEPVQVGLLPPREACAMLSGIAAARATASEITRIVDLCGYLPLGIRVAGGFLRQKNDWPASQYIAALERERLRWLRFGNDPEKDVEVVLKLSSTQLVLDSLDRATRWHLLHIFQGDFTLAMAAAVWNAAENDLGVLDDLSDMKNRSLLFYESNTNRYRLHDLMRLIAEGLFG